MYKLVDSFEPVKFMRLNIASFLANISFNENYIKCVKEFIANQKKYKIFNLLKSIRNGKNGK